MPKFRTGTDDFKELIDDGGYFVDKSMLIKEVIEGNKVTLLPRPRRFGKTLNMTMLRYFFEKTDDDKRALFDGLAISADADAMAHQAQYPIIYLSLKDIKGNDWPEAYASIQDKLSFLMVEHGDVRESVEPVRQREIDAIKNKTADPSTLKLSLKNLITYLHGFHGKPVVVLLDEYDSPIIEAWKKGYYDEMIDFMRSWLGGGLKHENAQALYRGVITGILRVARESIFSGLNNLDVASMLKAGPFADKFGFTQPELDKILVDFSLPELAEPMQTWYNGYNFGGHTIYNPWSVIQCIAEYPNPIGPQWLNTASNDLIHEELERGGLELKRDLEKLLAGQELRYPITESTVFGDIGYNPENIWSFLFFAGYLKASDPTRDVRGRLVYRLSIPNREVQEVYERFVERNFRLAGAGIERFLECFLKDGMIPELELQLNELVRNLVSVHDAARYPEAAYHCFVLGLLSGLRNVYEIRSNPEAGYGRADIVMRPKTSEYPLAFVMEFKAIAADGDLDASAREALRQIEQKAYAAHLIEAGIRPEMIRKLAIIVSGKRVKVQQR